MGRLPLKRRPFGSGSAPFGPQGSQTGLRPQTSLRPHPGLVWAETKGPLAAHLAETFPMPFPLGWSNNPREHLVVERWPVLRCP